MTGLLPVLAAGRAPGRVPGFPWPPLPDLDPVGALVSALSRAVTGGAQSLASAMFAHMTDALVATTQVRLDGWFTGPWRAMVAVAGMLALPILLCGVAQEVLAGRPGQAMRRGLLLPLAVGPALLVARAALGLVLLVVDASCALLVRVALGGPAGFASSLDHLRAVLGVTPGPLGPAAAGVGLLVVLLVVAVLAFVIWVELACRAALVLLLAAMVPLALAGLFWRATERWTRRLLEVLAAVVLSQLVITTVMVLAAAALADPGRGLAAGIDGVAVGLALLFLGSLGLPMTFRMLPHVAEAAVVVGGGAAVAGRLRSGGGQLLALAGPTGAARLAAGGVPAGPPGGGAPLPDRPASPPEGPGSVPPPTPVGLGVGRPAGPRGQR